MKNLWNAVTAALLASARARARQIMDYQSQSKQPAPEAYRSNAGGWN
ncbi:hypothetical protein [Massilia sp. KIM]|nr:hypothetical protein [Massilia sp. KIM]